MMTQSKVFRYMSPSHTISGLHFDFRPVDSSLTELIIHSAAPSNCGSSTASSALGVPFKSDHAPRTSGILYRLLQLNTQTNELAKCNLCDLRHSNSNSHSHISTPWWPLQNFIGCSLVLRRRQRARVSPSRRTCSAVSSSSSASKPRQLIIGTLVVFMSWVP